MTKPIAEQVAEVEVGDWVEARFEYRKCIAEIKGFLEEGLGNSLVLGIEVVRYNTGVINPILTSITRPIPSEPEVGSFALLRDTDVVLHVNSEIPQGWKMTDDEGFYNWPEIYPNIVKLYTPSGELVEGFEYYRAGQEG